MVIYKSWVIKRLNYVKNIDLILMKITILIRLKKKMEVIFLRPKNQIRKILKKKKFLRNHP